MRLVAQEGLWTTGPATLATPLVAVLEVSGAVLSWPVDDPAAPVHIAFTDVARADWLWQVVGDAGHAALVDSAAGHAAEGSLREVAGVDVPAAAVAPLRRLALGHWLRRWWPASRVDGISDLDSALLDAELALLTAAAEVFFTDDTVDSDAAELLRPHVGALASIAREGDPRVVELVGRCAELADDLGVAGLDQSLPVTVARSERRDDFALVAGAGAGAAGAGVIARGVGSIAWSAVPPGVFDAAEDSIVWSVVESAGRTVADIRTALLGAGPPAGIAVRFDSGSLGGTGLLDSAGRAVVPLHDAAGDPLPDAAAWDHDWRPTVVTVGADAVESRETRDRVRAFARARIARPGGDAFLAEVLAVESDY